MRSIFRIITTIFLIIIGHNLPIFAQSVSVTNLITIPTAEPLGKGGSATHFGMFQYPKVDLLPEHSQKVVIGGFEKSHRVTLEIETYLIPIRYTYGLSDHLDLRLGVTPSTGGVQKIVEDFYETDDPENNFKRVYEQPLYDGLFGLNYNIKPEQNDGFPSISVGGDVYTGFTADDRLNSDNDFLDNTPIDGFPYIGVNTYFVGSQKIGRFLKAHAGAGILLTSKALKVADLFTYNWMVGGELSVSDSMWFSVDFSRELHYAGINITNILGFAFRYEVSNRLAFQIGLNNLPGFQFSLMFGGTKAQETEGTQLLF